MHHPRGSLCKHTPLHWNFTKLVPPHWNFTKSVAHHLNESRQNLVGAPMELCSFLRTNLAPQSPNENLLFSSVGCTPMKYRFLTVHPCEEFQQYTSSLHPLKSLYLCTLIWIFYDNLDGVHPTRDLVGQGDTCQGTDFIKRTEVSNQKIPTDRRKIVSRSNWVSPPKKHFDGDTRGRRPRKFFFRKR